MGHNFTGDKSQTRAGGRYDKRHKDARAAAARVHNPNDLCTRCHQPLGPMGPHLHYDHAEHGGYLGFAHGPCNVRAGSDKGNALQRHTPSRRQPARRWAL